MTDDTMAGTGKTAGATPASRSLTGSVPVTGVGMGSGTAERRRDFGGASMADTARTGSTG
jgi:DHA2 family multidrug resistance protein-like MFS transporter